MLFSQSAVFCRLPALAALVRRVCATVIASVQGWPGICRRWCYPLWATVASLTSRFRPQAFAFCLSERPACADTLVGAGGWVCASGV